MAAANAQYLSLVGRALHVSEVTAVECSLPLLAQRYGAPAELWGKVLGYKRDYVVAQLRPGDFFGPRVTFASVDGGNNWTLLSDVSADQAVLCEELRGPFVGDLNYLYKVRRDIPDAPAEPTVDLPAADDALAQAKAGLAEAQSDADDEEEEREEGGGGGGGGGGRGRRRGREAQEEQAQVHASLRDGGRAAGPLRAAARRRVPPRRARGVRAAGPGGGRAQPLLRGPGAQQRSQALLLPQGRAPRRPRAQRDAVRPHVQRAHGLSPAHHGRRAGRRVVREVRRDAERRCGAEPPLRGLPLLVPPGDRGARTDLRRHGRAQLRPVLRPVSAVGVATVQA
ncbi:radial spoke head protein 9 [Strigomonas culicis]|uniref:Radial spoke head protein 9 n=1 Tax=Strigomonas culicis TaxID=28005 RepID=S9VLP9_9TRYP|nr:radial spoke head protein 9 [Strigomonas culicis]|eukprot:EPY24115.1 radial spoke head protein 9 [Strigomonas culicis]